MNEESPESAELLLALDRCSKLFLSEREFKSLEDLLQRGASADAAQKISGITALQLAVDNIELVRLLLDQDADINKKNSTGHTVLNFAAYRGHEAVVLLLLERGADVTSLNDDGQTVLECIESKDFPEIKKLLQEFPQRRIEAAKAEAQAKRAEELKLIDAVTVSRQDALRALAQRRRLKSLVPK